MIQLKFLIMAVSVLGLVSLAGGTAYFKHQADKYRSEAERATYSYDSAVAALQSYADEIVARNRSIEALESAFNSATEKERKAGEIFKRHDLQNLLDSKPGLVSRWASARLNGMFDKMEAGTGTGTSD